MSALERQADIDYWGLTPRESIAHFDRLIAYHRRLGAKFDAEYERFSRLARRLRLAFVVTVGVSLCLIVINRAG